MSLILVIYLLLCVDKVKLASILEVKAPTCFPFHILLHALSPLLFLTDTLVYRSSDHLCGSELNGWAWAASSALHCSLHTWLVTFTVFYLKQGTWLSIVGSIIFRVFPVSNMWNLHCSIICSNKITLWKGKPLRAVLLGPVLIERGLLSVWI